MADPVQDDKNTPDAKHRILVATDSFARGMIDGAGFIIGAPGSLWKHTFGDSKGNVADIDSVTDGMTSFYDGYLSNKYVNLGPAVSKPQTLDMTDSVIAGAAGFAGSMVVPVPAGGAVAKLAGKALSPFQGAKGVLEVAASPGADKALTWWQRTKLRYFETGQGLAGDLELAARAPTQEQRVKLARAILSEARNAPGGITRQTAVEVRSSTKLTPEIKAEVEKLADKRNVVTSLAPGRFVENHVTAPLVEAANYPFITAMKLGAKPITIPVKMAKDLAIGGMGAKARVAAILGGVGFADYATDGKIHQAVGDAYSSYFGGLKHVAGVDRNADTAEHTDSSNPGVVTQVAHAATAAATGAASLVHDAANASTPGQLVDAVTKSVKETAQKVSDASAPAPQTAGAPAADDNDDDLPHGAGDVMDWLERKAKGHPELQGYIEKAKNDKFLRVGLVMGAGLGLFQGDGIGGKAGAAIKGAIFWGLALSAVGALMGQNNSLVGSLFGALVGGGHSEGGEYGRHSSGYQRVQGGPPDSQGYGRYAPGYAPGAYAAPYPQQRQAQREYEVPGVRPTVYGAQPPAAAPVQAQQPGLSVSGLPAQPGTNKDIYGQTVAPAASRNGTVAQQADPIRHDQDSSVAFSDVNHAPAAKPEQDADFQRFMQKSTANVSAYGFTPAPVQVAVSTDKKTNEDYQQVVASAVQPQPPLPQKQQPVPLSMTI